MDQEKYLNLSEVEKAREDFINRPGVASMQEVAANLDASHICRWKSMAGELFNSGNQIDDILEVPERLGEHSKIVIAKSIWEFRSTLAKARALFDDSTRREAGL